jgi:hypothetical protein
MRKINIDGLRSPVPSWLPTTALTQGVAITYTFNGMPFTERTA